MKTPLLLFLLCCMLQAAAQDTHFSHIHASPLHNNPAWTGVFNDNFRLIVNYRNQWKTPTANYNTIHLSFDGKYVIPKTRMSLNGGISFQSDRGGDLGYGDHNYNLLGGATFPIGKRGINNFSVGIQAGFIRHHMDVTAIESIDVEPLAQYIQLNPSGVDLSAGIGYFLALSKTKSIYAGVAAYHLNQVNASLVEGAEQPLYKRWVANLGANWEFKSGIGLQPGCIAYWQGPHREINIGSYVSFPITKKHHGKGHDTRLYFGAWSRYYVQSKYKSGFDALIFSTRYDFDKLVVGFSCDVTLSKLTSANGLVGSPEVSLMYSFPTEKRNKPVKSRVDCPKF